MTTMDEMNARTMERMRKASWRGKMLAAGMTEESVEGYDFLDVVPFANDLDYEMVDGVLRFKASPLFRFICDGLTPVYSVPGTFTLNDLGRGYAYEKFGLPEYMRFMALTGYSVSGWSDYFSDALDELEQGQHKDLDWSGW